MTASTPSLRFERRPNWSIVNIHPNCETIFNQTHECRSYGRKIGGYSRTISHGVCESRQVLPPELAEFRTTPFYISDSAHS